VKAVAFIAIAGACLITLKGHGAGADQQLDGARRPGVSSRLAPTEHAPLPAHPSHFWLVPERSTARGSSATTTSETTQARFARGVKLYGEENFAAALPLVSAPALANTPLSDYAQFYTALVQIGLTRIDDAAATLDALAARKPTGYLAEAVAMKRAEVAMTRKDPRGALAALEPLSREKNTAPETVLLQLGRAAQEAGDRDKAIATYLKLYFEYPLSADADLAKIELDLLEKPDAMSAERYSQELGRAERQFNARRYDDARASFVRLLPGATGDNKELVALRIAECDYYLRKYRASRDALRAYLEGSKREAEARFFHLTATRAFGDLETYVALARGLVAAFPQESWSEETLNNLASHYIIENDDAEADKVFRELLDRFPQSRYRERASWKIGWWAYKNGDHAETVRVFEEAAATMPRADTRPAWLFWSGRANEALGHRDAAVARYRLVATDYLNSYYGRLAAKALDVRKEPAVSASVESAPTSSPVVVPNDAIIRQLLAAELYEDAVRELQYAQRIGGDSPAIQATYGWIYNRQGDLRRGINAMKRAYPQYLAAGGEELPADLLGVLFPLDYWPLIKKYSEAHQLDPYLISALIAQESTFDHDVRSAANAYGLMQVIPGTGRRYARSLGIRRFSTATLTNAESNVRIGTAYFKDLVDRFGGAHFALASYNAGEHRIARWISERPGITQEEFIDDIPFPETQNYVKKILGTAEDYRRLYGGGLLVPGQAPGVKAEPPAGKKPAAQSSKSKASTTKSSTKSKASSAKTKPKAKSQKPKAGR
jgi:soluble lytic murein transglycosylase